MEDVPSYFLTPLSKSLLTNCVKTLISRFLVADGIYPLDFFCKDNSSTEDSWTEKNIGKVQMLN